MARLPVSGSDNGTWGDILNEFLVQSHTPQGALKDNVVGSSQIQTGVVSSTKLSDGAITQDKLATDAVTSDKIADDAVTADKIPDGTVTQDKLSTSVQDTLSEIGTKVLLIDTAGDLPPGTPAGVIVVVKS